MPEWIRRRLRRTPRPTACCTRSSSGRPDLTIHHLRHTALTLAGQHGATAAELQARAGHASQAALAIYQHATRDRDRLLAQKIGETYEEWQAGRRA